tara:strand:+ start:4290 stop:4454 length:165 start_codon:yes stop_codon:yes gene_type:complete
VKRTRCNRAPAGGGIPKNEMGWANFNARLESEELNEILPNDHSEISDLVAWITA